MRVGSSQTVIRVWGIFTVGSGDAKEESMVERGVAADIVGNGAGLPQETISPAIQNIQKRKDLFDLVSIGIFWRMILIRELTGVSELSMP